MKPIYILITTLLITNSQINAEIIMGVVPQQSPLVLIKAWSPIAKYLSEKTGEKISFKTEKSIDKFEKVLHSGGYDFAYMNPYHYISANQLQGYTAGLRAAKDIKGILVAKDVNVMQRALDKEIVFLFPSPIAFAATLLTKYDLIKKYGVSIEKLNEAKYVNSHDSVYKGISRGIGDIGGGIERTFKNLKDIKTKNSLKIVHTTKAYPSHPIAFHKSMPNEIKNKIITALLNMPKSYLKKLSIKKLVKTQDKEYDSIKEITTKLNIIPK